MPRGVSRYDDARLQQRLWSPDLVRPAIWLDANDPSTIEIVSGRVSEWRDKSGSGHNYTQATSGLRPTYEYTVPDAGGRVPLVNQIGVRFNAHFLANSTFAYAGNVVQVFNVHRNLSTPLPSTTTYGRVFSFSLNSLSQDYNTTDGLIVTYGVVANAAALFRANATIASTGATNNLWAIINARRLAGTGRIALNGGTYATGTTSTANQSIGYSRIGNDNNATDSGMNGWICESLVFTTQLSDAQCQIVEGYLAWKWGLVALLPASHPYVNRPPLIGD